MASNKKILACVIFSAVIGVVFWQASRQQVNPSSATPTDQAVMTEPTDTQVTLSGQSVQSSDALSNQAHMHTHDKDQPLSVGQPVVQKAAPQTHSLSESASRVDPMTGLPPDKNDPVLIAKRKQVFDDITDILTNMARGVKPERTEMITHAQDMVALTEQGYIPKADALNSMAFLQKAFPELKTELQTFYDQMAAL